MPKIVILIEDETNIRSMYAEILKDEGYDVVEISEGKEGLDVLKEGKWDLLLLDIMLPKLDGVELLKKLNEIKDIKDRPVLILTNLQDEEIRNACLELGVREYLVKSNIVPSDVVLNVKKYVFNE